MKQGDTEMGYSTNFDGRFNLNRPLTVPESNYLKAFAGTRRMGRDSTIAETMDDPKRLAVGLPIGVEGGYFVGGGGLCGQARDASITDFNREPMGQPGLWCQWVPSEDGTGIEWNGGEKFYKYTEWINWLANGPLLDWQISLVDGDGPRWSGEEVDDIGVLRVIDGNVIADTLKHTGTKVECPDCGNEFYTNPITTKELG